MIHSFEADTADQAWRKAARTLYSHSSEAKHEKSRLGLTVEILHAHFSIRNPRQRWVYGRQPAISPAFAIAEVFWILSGRNDATFLNFWNPILPEYAGRSDLYHGAYGYRIRKNFGIDQLERAYQVLSRNPKSRQVVLQIWDPTLDLPSSDGAPASPDIPCNVCCMPKLRGGRLEWMQIMRSNDLFRGMPYNIIQFTAMQEVLAGWLGAEMGSYHQLSDSLHIYIKDYDQFSIHEQADEVPNCDTLALSRRESAKILPLMVNKLDRLADQNLKIKSFNRICLTDDIGDSYRNMLLIAAADSARRRGWVEEMRYAASGCTNPALNFVWSQWEHRTRTKKD